MSSATENNGLSPDMSEVELLAPWCATGKLDEADARQIERLAKDSPEFARLMEETKRERKATIAVNEALDKPPRALWERLERSVEQDMRETSESSRRASFARLKASLSEFFDGFSMRRWQAVAAAAIAICVAQAAVIAYLAQETGEPAKYGAASGPKAGAAVKPAFIVSFTQTATMAEVNEVLEDAGARIVDGPSGDGFYRLGLNNDSVAARDLAYKKLRASATVKLTLIEK